MNKYRRFALFIPALLAALMLGGCTQNGAGAASVETRLLEDMAGQVGPGELELVSLHYGSFSGNDAQEVAAVFHAVEEADPAGQTITSLGIYDADSLEPVAYLPNLSGDGGSAAFHFLDSQAGQTYILALAGGASQGILYTWPQLLTVEDGEWVEHTIPGVEQNASCLLLATAHMGKPLMLTALEDDGQFRGLHQYTELLDNVAFSLLWSEQEGSFVPLDENWATVS